MQSTLSSVVSLSTCSADVRQSSLPLKISSILLLTHQFENNSIRTYLLHTRLPNPIPYHKTPFSFRSRIFFLSLPQDSKSHQPQPQALSRTIVPTSKLFPYFDFDTCPAKLCYYTSVSWARGCLRERRLVHCGRPPSPNHTIGQSGKCECLSQACVSCQIFCMNI